MLSREIRNKIKHVEIYTRRILNNALVGDSRSALKGTGFEFDQIRDYALGDDIRTIDWNSSCRMNKLLVKQYQEERTRTVIIALDISKSGLFTSAATLRSDMLKQIGAVLSLVATYGKDELGLLLFSDDIELYLPPSRSVHQIHTIMKTVFTVQARGKATNIEKALTKLSSLKKRDAVIFFISDFITEEDFSKPLKVLAHKHDLVAIRCLDQQEKKISSLGFLTIEDCETGSRYMVDLREAHAKKISHYLHERLSEQTILFKKSGIEYIDMYTDKPFMLDLIRFFRKRMMY